MNLINALSAGVVLACFYVYLCYSCFKDFNEFKAKKAGRTFNFHITDLWAMTIAMAPTVYLGRYLAEQSGEWSVFALAAAIPSQLAWMFKGRLSVLESRSTSAIESALMVICFGLFGLMFAPVFIIAFTTFFPTMVVYLVLYQRRNLSTNIASSRLSGRHS